LAGLWSESIDTNRRAAASADDSITHDGHHASDYMVYAHLQLAQDRAARRVMDQHRARKGIDFFGVAYPYAAIPARIALERGAWNEAANLELFPAKGAYPWEKYPQAEAVHVQARGIGLAMGGESQKAYAEVARLTELREAAASMKLGYWVEQIEIQSDVVRGLAMLAEGKRDEALGILRRAADREDASAKHVVTPGASAPAREMLALALQRSGRHAEALAEFERALQEQPNRYRAIAGAAQSALRAQSAQKAAYYSAQLAKLVDQADTQRPEMAGASRQLAR
jgi:tetratricopeptide (TPR) repeat protein